MLGFCHCVIAHYSGCCQTGLYVDCLCQNFDARTHMHTLTLPLMLSSTCAPVDLFPSSVFHFPKESLQSEIKTMNFPVLEKAKINVEIWSLLTGQEHVGEAGGFELSLAAMRAHPNLEFVQEQVLLLMYWNCEPDANKVCMCFRLSHPHEFCFSSSMPFIPKNSPHTKSQEKHSQMRKSKNANKHIMLPRIHDGRNKTLTEK